MHSTFFRSFLAAALLTFATGAPAHAVLVAYWDMDASSISAKRTPDGGTQSGSVALDVAYASGWDTDIINIPGTPVNVVPLAGVPNQAIRFDTSLAVLQDTPIITITGLNFTGLENVEVSFAAQGDSAFSWNSEIHLDYSLSGGVVSSWVDWADAESNTGGVWELDTFPMPSALDGEGNVALRVRTSSGITFLEDVDFDNIQITAVPEPRLLATLLGVFALAIAVLPRRRG